jgi:hypothetical protein
MPKQKLNPGHYLELMDRLHVVMCTIDDHILKHPVTKSDTRIKSLIGKALEELWDAYQIAGELDCKNNE